MKIRNFIYTVLFAGGIVAGIYIAGFAGGFIAGACSILLIFVTIGKHLARNAQRRIDAAVEMKRKFYNS